MRIQELFEAKNAGENLRTAAFMHGDIYKTKAALRAAVQDAAKEHGVKVSIKRVDDKDLPGYDLIISGPEQGVAKFVQKIVMKKGTPLKAAMAFAKAERIDEIRGDFDLTDPEGKPEVRKAMDTAYDTHAKKTAAAVDMWDKLAKKLKAVKVQNQGESGFGTRSYIIMKLPDDYRIGMFRDDVMLNLPKGQTLSKDDEAKIKAIFKDAGENLYGTNFSTMGDGPGPNAVRTGYYTSIAHNPKFADAIVNTLKYLKTRA
jgi:hypothetical protein